MKHWRRDWPWACTDTACPPPACCRCLLPLSFNHPSNGRSGPLSRSWNRLIVSAGIEQGNLALLGRLWWRIPESADTDDNPTISDYCDWSDLSLLYQWRGQSVAATIRGNPSTGKSAGRLTYTSARRLGPLRGDLKLFSGYRETLIDCHWKQSTIGLGITLNDWLSPPSTRPPSSASLASAGAGVAFSVYDLNAIQLHNIHLSEDPLKTTILRTALVLITSLGAATAAWADEGSRWDDGIGFYVGVDSRITFPSGTYAGQTNPNAGRLTFLFDHGDHFHGIGTYSLSGPAGAPVTLPTNTNNRIPETYTGLTSIPLQKGSGAFAGTWASKVLPDSDPAHEYSHLGIASIQSLKDLSPLADVLFHSSGDRWNAQYQNTTVALKLLSATPGLKVAAGGMMDIFGGGDTYTLGSSQSFEFLPTYYVAAGAAPGIYTAEFMLVNAGSNANARNGGTFYLDFHVPTPVPEPGTWALFGLGLVALTWLGRRRSSSGR